MTTTAAAVVVAAAALLLASADTTIKLGSSYPFSGPASAYSAIPKALNGFFKKLNDNGGVNGRKVQFITYDDGYEPQRALANAKRLVEQDKVFAIVNPLGTANNLAMQDYLNQNKVPQLFVATGATVFGSGQAKFPYTTGWPADVPDRVEGLRGIPQDRQAERQGGGALPERRLRQGPARRFHRGHQGHRDLDRRPGDATRRPTPPSRHR